MIFFLLLLRLGWESILGKSVGRMQSPIGLVPGGYNQLFR